MKFPLGLKGRTVEYGSLDCFAQRALDHDLALPHPQHLIGGRVGEDHQPVVVGDDDTEGSSLQRSR